jgi:hypothetical protein
VNISHSLDSVVYIKAIHAGKTGKGVLDDIFEAISQSITGRFPFAPCPSCQEFVAGHRYKDWVTKDIDAVLTLCQYVKFDDEETEVPLYLGDLSSKSWTLCHGIYCLVFSPSVYARTYTFTH